MYDKNLMILIYKRERERDIYNITFTIKFKSKKSSNNDHISLFSKNMTGTFDVGNKLNE